MDGGTLRELAIKVSQYFLDFLESDFKRQQAPRRRIVLQTDAGFKAGMRVAPYPALQRDLWECLAADGNEELALKILPGSYKRPISQTLKSIISEQIQALAETALQTVRHEVVIHAQQTRSHAVENPERWVDSVRGALCTEIGAQIIGPLLAMLDGPMTQQAYSVHDSIFATEGELIELLAARSDQLLPDVLSRYLAIGDTSPLSDLLESTLAIDEVRSALLEYFERYMAADAFLEFRDLETYATTSENLQLYLYVGTLKFGAHTYPIFYIPVDVKRVAETGGYTLTLVRHLYANKRALEFVLQEVGERQQRQWLSPIKERISYLNPIDSLADIATPQFRDIVNALDLGGQVQLGGGPVTQASNTHLAVSTGLHLAAFDRADEALLNDYEEMISQARQNEAGVVGLFEGIVRGVIEENPKSIHHSVDGDWDALPIIDRVVIDSPVPMNEEQIKILSAVRQPEGRIIVVEGPPGTGKSHTITAIAADCALSGRSCLVLSDKTEALNVVQDKLTQAMNQARHDKNFPNPILRLGQEQANFRKLTSNQSFSAISAYVRAAKTKQPQLRTERDAKRKKLKDDIAQTVRTYESISISAIQNLFRLEAALETLAPGLAPSLQKVAGKLHHPLLTAAIPSLSVIREYLGHVFSVRKDWTATEFTEESKLDASAVEIALEVKAGELDLFDNLSVDDCYQLELIFAEFERLRMPLFGYLFRGGAIVQLETRILERLKPARPIVLKKDKVTVESILKCVREVRRLLPSKHLTEKDLPRIYPKLCKYKPPAGAVAAQHICSNILDVFGGEYPASLLSNAAGTAPEIWTKSISYLDAFVPLETSFRSVPEFDYVGTMSQLEKLNVTSMNAEVDNRLVNFMTNFKADAKTLSSIITNRQKFPEDKFDNVKSSFPVILASIRQFGEYMPLAPDMFDVVIIDEASQVSVAQAFPALLRAKKLVVLGDSKQFSNVKSANASNEQNEKYRSELEAFFRQKVSREAGTLERLAKFDVKCSILDFCQLCANYSTMLRKHFRSYQELISYSSQTFYGGQLQAIKIRAVPLNEVICFDEVDPSTGTVTRRTNEPEAQFILARLEELLEEDEPPTVGIITPFREQQAFLTKLLFGHAKGAAFQDALRLKVMTFDSCQGEERKIIFYSLVATEESDLLNYIFPVDIGQAEEVVEEKLKHQRLNVGFSRAEEMIWFVLSKPVANFKGSIGKVLHHYSNLLLKGEVDVSRTDPASPMEARVLDWLQKTTFYQNNVNAIEILPQFPVGDYLRQLDPTYKHPAWRVDFLITFATPNGFAKIVLEYDGFEYHFQDSRNVNAGNYDRYMLEADVERQLTLESYGYRFLRINRFNLGTDPVQTLSDRLERLVESLNVEQEPGSIKTMRAEAENLASGKLKTCPKCGESRQPTDFYDQKLKGGKGSFGRNCKFCKEVAPASHKRRWRRW